ncbi:hypothetical protein HK097_008180, partial [Rhizophlyctis rosea]
RARQTAEIVAQKHPNTPFLEIEPLAEIHWGDWDGKRAPQLKKLLAKWAEGDYEAKSPNGESPLEVEQRAVPAIYNLLNRPESTFLIVVHGRLLRIILSSIVYHSLQHMQSFTHHNTTVNVIDAIVETDPSRYPDFVGEPAAPQPDGESVVREAERRPDRKGDDSFVPGTEEDGSDGSAAEEEDGGRPKNPPRLNTSLKAGGVRSGELDGNGNGKGLESPTTAIRHLENVKFVPVMLDSYEHLPEELVLD